MASLRNLINVTRAFVLLFSCFQFQFISTTSHQDQRFTDETLIETSNGKLRGTSYYLDNNLNLVNDSSPSLTRKINAWLGIPYAEKPLGELRFKRPLSVKNWKPQVLDATRLPNSCFQQRDTLFPNFEGAEQWNPNTAVSEDCLYLNIWTPSIKSSTKKKIPVLVC